MANDDLGFTVYNYCVCFIDLLGQRNAMSKPHLVPSEPEKLIEFKQKIFNSVGRIRVLQERAKSFMSLANEGRTNSEYKASLPEHLHDTWDELGKAELKCQNWSDGVMHYVPLITENVKCPINGVFHLLSLAGVLCFIGLTEKTPLRGAIEIGWGAELNENELYGAAIANAYDLESNVAQYPRIVVGVEAYNYINTVLNDPGDDFFAEQNRLMAQACLDTLVQDVDGNLIVNYLGESFHKSIPYEMHKEMYNAAISFVYEQHTKFYNEKDSKLAFRYAHLLDYFTAHPLKE